MPKYCFSCSCGSKTEVIRSIKNRNRRVDCDCGLQMTRDFSAEQYAAPNEMSERTSLAMSCDPSQVREFNRDFGSDGAHWRGDGTYVYTKRSDHIKAMRSRGIFDRQEIVSPRNI
jgi:predicted nucleic acid-binding Zn ribbon protein